MERTSSKIDEIDLLNVAKTLWEKRKIIIASTLGFIVSGTMFAFSQTMVYEGNIVVHPLTDAELVGFNKLNQVMSVTHSKDPVLSTSMVTSRRLMNSFRNHSERGKF